MEEELSEFWTLKLSQTPTKKELQQIVKMICNNYTSSTKPFMWQVSDNVMDYKDK